MARQIQTTEQNGRSEFNEIGQGAYKCVNGDERVNGFDENVRRWLKLCFVIIKLKVLIMFLPSNLPLLHF